MYGAKLIWESAIDHFNEFMGELVTSPIELVDKNTKISLKRADDFTIQFELKTSNLGITDTFFHGERKVGEVYSATQDIELINDQRLTKVKLNNVLIDSRNTEISPYDPEKNTNYLNGQIGEITAEITERQEDYSFDWLLNVSFDSHSRKNCGFRFHGDSIDFEYDVPQRDTLGLTKLDVRNCFKINIFDTNIIIGQLKNEKAHINDKYKPGFIFYTKVIAEEIKEKIREALSFLFGRKLIFIGSSKFTLDAFLIGYKAVTPYLISDKIFSEPSSPPCDFFEMPEGHTIPIFKYLFIETFITKFVEEYEDKNIEHIMWMYWHSFYAPIHSASGSFGAIIEFILSKVDIEKNLISKSIFTPFRKKVIEDFQTFYIESGIEDEDVNRIMISKINDLNRLPIAKMTERSFQRLGVTISDFEKSLWQKRHDSAHGNITDGDIDSLIRGVHAFMSVCNRSILKFLDLSDNYIDYFNYDYPVKNIDEPLIDLEEA
ncbi:hypothetical protein A1E08_RS06070 [Acinetobacter baumannii]|nr:hypothetical protein [Acinetobacter baumannii]